MSHSVLIIRPVGAKDVDDGDEHVFEPSETFETNFSKHYLVLFYPTWAKEFSE